MRVYPLLAVALLVAPLAYGSDTHVNGSTDSDSVDCSVDVGGKDRVAKGRDVVILAGETVDDAVAVDGNVILRAGAKVKSALALHGSVIVEAGAEVSDSVVAVGGKTQVSKDAHVHGSTLALDANNGLHVSGDDGNDLDVAVNINGKSLARELLEPVIQGIHRCRIVPARTK